MMVAHQGACVIFRWLIDMSVVPKPDPEPAPKVPKGGLLRHVPVRVLLIVLVLVPWGGMAYRTGDRIDHDRGELAFTEELAPAAGRVKLLAQIQRELEKEAAAAELKLEGTFNDVSIENDLIESRSKIDRAVGMLPVFGPTGIQRADLKRVRDRFDSVTKTRTTSDGFESGYGDLLASNRAALNTSVRELWVRWTQRTHRSANRISCSIKQVR
jgi:hypothetical protein